MGLHGREGGIEVSKQAKTNKQSTNRTSQPLRQRRGNVDTSNRSEFEHACRGPHRQPGRPHPAPATACRDQAGWPRRGTNRHRCLVAPSHVPMEQPEIEPIEHHLVNPNADREQRHVHAPGDGRRCRGVAPDRELPVPVEHNQGNRKRNRSKIYVRHGEKRHTKRERRAASAAAHPAATETGRRFDGEHRGGGNRTVKRHITHRSASAGENRRLPQNCSKLVIMKPVPLFR